MFELVLCPLLMLAVVAAPAAAVRARRRGVRRIRSFCFGAVAVVALFLTWMVYGLGEFSALHREIGELCPAQDAGEMVGYHCSGFPWSHMFECSAGKINLVPAWVNPMLFVLMAAAIGLTAMAIVVWCKRI